MTFALGADVGASNVRVGLVESDGPRARLIELRRMPWRAGRSMPTVADLAAAIEQLAVELTDAHGVARAGLVLGAGVAGQLSADARVVRNAPNIGWRDVSLAAELERHISFTRRVVLANDLKAILAGEMSAGAACGAQNVLAAYLGTGLGGAFAVDGRIVAGTGGNAGEIGHVKLPALRSRCGCGQRGCVESFVGGAALQRRMDRAARGPAAHLAVSGELRVDQVDRAAHGGDRWADALWCRVADALGHVIGGACTLLNPQLLVLGGGVFEHAPHLRWLVGQRVAAMTVAVAASDLRVVDGTLGDSAGILGAAHLAATASRS